MSILDEAMQSWKKRKDEKNNPKSSIDASIKSS